MVEETTVERSKSEPLPISEMKPRHRTRDHLGRLKRAKTLRRRASCKRWESHLGSVQAFRLALETKCGRAPARVKIRRRQVIVLAFMKADSAIRMGVSVNRLRAEGDIARR